MVASGSASVVILDRAHLLADWRDLLAFLLQPEHQCCIILIDTGQTGHYLRDEFLDEGGYACLLAPLQELEVIRAVHEAAARWHNIQRAYGR